MKFKRGILAIAIVLMLSGCATSGSVPEATPNPDITHPEGKVISVDPKGIEGTVTSLTKNKITIKVDGVEWELYLSDKAKQNLDVFKTKDMEIKKGTFVIAYYDEQDGKRTASSLEIVNKN